MQEIVHNPVDDIYAATPDYVHALEVRRPERWLYVAGTMGLSADGSAPKTLEEQLERIWANIRVILAQANMTTDNIVRLESLAEIRAPRLEHSLDLCRLRLEIFGGLLGSPVLCSSLCSHVLTSLSVSVGVFLTTSLCALQEINATSFYMTDVTNQLTD